MTKIQQDWKDLPSEILLQIFLSATKADLRKCALVCKAWSDPAQSILYSNVIIVNPQQLQKFHGSITRTLHLGEQVKCLCVNSISSRYDQYPIENFSELLSNMLCSGLLTNLQELDISILNTYIPVLSALLNLRLKALKVLHPPRKDLNRDQRVIYASCILLMRDRVEKVALYNEEARANNFRSNHLYNNLNQLRVLKEVKISDDIGDQWILSVEHVTASCKALKKLTLDFKVGNNNKDVDMSSIVPSTNIESLNVQLRDKRMLFHIMHKFPQLREMTINNWNCELVSEEYLQLLAFISKIDAFQITRLYVNHNIAELTAHYWDTTLARTGSKIVKALYHDIDIYEDYGIEISKLKDEKRPTFSFSYHQIQANPQHIETVDMLGKYIGEFHFIYGKRKNSSKGDLPQLFMDHLFMRCPHLHTLYFEGWVFHKRYLLLQNFPIDELYFKIVPSMVPFLATFPPFCLS
ncbi:unnamed protein product [Mucor hiemalis]